MTETGGVGTSGGPGLLDRIGWLGRRGSMRHRAAVGSLWVVGGHGASQILRLGSNLVLTRLLFPEAFGLMALVQVFLQGLQMFSDVGIRASIVHSSRGDQQTFLDTAWTIQIIRGLALWLVSVAGAVPFARFFGEPSLAGLVPVAGLAAVLSGLESTKVPSNDREIRLARTTMIEVGSQAAAVVVMIGWAMACQTVWALVAGGLVRVGLRVLMGHLLLPGERNRIRWDLEGARELMTFGRWIFISTVVTFLLRQGDKFVLGKLVDASALGVYAIGAMWSQMALDVGLQVGGRVIFPALSEAGRGDRSVLRARFRRARVVFMGVLLPVTLGLAVFGDLLISLMYDERYEDAGWMVRILAVGGSGAVISALSGNVQLALGDSFRNMTVQVVRGGLLIVCMLAGWHFGGLPGLIAGVAAAKFADYPVIAWGLAKHGVWLWDLDLAAYAATAAVVGLGMWLNPLELSL